MQLVTYILHVKCICIHRCYVYQLLSAWLKYRMHITPVFFFFQDETSASDLDSGTCHLDYSVQVTWADTALVLCICLYDLVLFSFQNESEGIDEPWDNQDDSSFQQDSSFDLHKSSSTIIQTPLPDRSEVRIQCIYMLAQLLFNNQRNDCYYCCSVITKEPEKVIMQNFHHLNENFSIKLMETLQ